jgi:hypothetical protein
MDIKVAKNYKCQRDQVVSLFDTNLNCDFFRKFAYENVQRETTRFFIDIDLKNHCNGPQIEKEIIKQLDYQKKSMEFVYTNGSTPTKISFHIISTTQTIQKKTFRKEMAKEWLKAVFTEDSIENSTNTLPFPDLFNAVDNSVYKNQKYFRLPYGVCQEKVTPHIPNDTSDMKEYFISYIKEDMTPFPCEAVPEKEKIRFTGLKDSGENDPINIKKYKKNLMTLLERIDKKRFKAYSTFIELLFLMKGRGLEEDDFIQFSKDSEYEKFSEEDCRDHWFRCDAKPMLGLTRAIDWCKEDGIDWMPLIYTEKEIKDKKKALQKYQENKEEIELQKALTLAYTKLKESFELNNAKVLSTGEFVHSMGEENYFKNKGTFMTTHEHIHYKPEGEDEGKSFIGRWIKDEDIKTYDKIDCIPHSMPQNPRILNTWRPFPKHSAVMSPELHQPFLDHIHILVGRQENVSSFYIKNLAHSLQYPHIKLGTMISLIGKEGAGKGVLWEFHKKLVGDYNCFETTKLGEICGHFNHLMAKAYWVFINEGEFKALKEHESVLKGLITDKVITINGKNQAEYKANSYHRFLSAGNGEELPCPSSKYDRRKMIVKTSSELIGNKAYFTELVAMINEPDRIASFYNYLMSLDVKNLHLEEIPKTEYQLDVQELFKSPVEMWLEHLAFTQEADVVKMTGTEQLFSYNAFRNSHSIHLELSSVALAMKLKLLKIEGVSDTIKGKESNYRNFNRELLRRHFNL